MLSLSKGKSCAKEDQEGKSVTRDSGLDVNKNIQNCLLSLSHVIGEGLNI